MEENGETELSIVQKCLQIFFDYMKSELESIYEPQHVISNNVVCATSKGSDQTSHMRSLIRAVYSMNIKLLIEYHLQFLSLKGDCKGSHESTFVKITHCWKSHTTTQL